MFKCVLHPILLILPPSHLEYDARDEDLVLLQKNVADEIKGHIIRSCEEHSVFLNNIMIYTKSSGFNYLLL